jgi:hypothetical protein
MRRDKVLKKNAMMTTEFIVALEGAGRTAALCRQGFASPGDRMGRCPHCRRRIIPLRHKYTATLLGDSIDCPGCGKSSRLPPWGIALLLPVIASLFIFSILESRPAWAILAGTLLACLIAWAALPLVRQS